jgi:hypothetical protein
VDTKDGITVARCKFGSSSNGQAIIKVEGVLPADPNTVYQFLKISTKDGGKVYIHVVPLAEIYTAAGSFLGRGGGGDGSHASILFLKLRMYM